jgi:hypothetical protein
MGIPALGDISLVKLNCYSSEEVQFTYRIENSDSAGDAAFVAQAIWRMGLFSQEVSRWAGDSLHTFGNPSAGWVLLSQQKG